MARSSRRAGPRLDCLTAVRSRPRDPRRWPVDRAEVRGRRAPARDRAGTRSPTRHARPVRPSGAAGATSRSRLSEVAADRARSPRRSGQPACSTRKSRARWADTSASCIRPRWSWSAVTRAIRRVGVGAERLAHELQRVAQPLAGDPELVERVDVRPAQHRLVRRGPARRPPGSATRRCRGRGAAPSGATGRAATPSCRTNSA